jgi:hypothetical protein
MLHYEIKKLRVTSLSIYSPFGSLQTMTSLNALIFLRIGEMENYQTAGKSMLLKSATSYHIKVCYYINTIKLKHYVKENPKL